MRLIIIFLLVIFWISPFNTWGQVPEETYERILNDKISPSGNIVSFYSVKNKKTSILVKDLKGNKTFEFENVIRSTVLTDSLFIAYSYERKELYMLDFILGKMDTLRGVAGFKYIEKSNSILINLKNEQKLSVFNIGTKKYTKFNNVKDYYLSTNEEKIYLIGDEDYLTVWNIDQKKRNKVLKGQLVGDEIKKVISNSKDSIAYFLTHNNNSVSIFELKNQGVNKIFEKKIIDSVYNTIVDTLFTEAVVFNANHIILKQKKLFNLKKKSEVEIWKGNLEGISADYPRQSSYSDQLLLIDIANKKEVLLDSDPFIRYKINKNSETIYAYHYNENSNLTRQFPLVDLYQYDLVNDTLYFVDKFNGANYNWFQTKELPYLFYFKSEQWHYYDPINKIHKNISSFADDVFLNLSVEYAKLKGDEGYSNFGVLRDKRIVFNGFNDVWIFDIPNNQLEKLTDGKIENRKYQILECNFSSSFTEWSWNYDRRELPFKNRILKWELENSSLEGISIEENNKIINLDIDFKGKISQVERTVNYISYIKERNNFPPTIYIYDIKNKKEIEVYKSNNWDNEAKNVKTEYVNWRNQKGESRGAIIRYPKNYDSTLKYPAILSVYELKSKTQNYYYSPFEIGDGYINIRNYIDDGYFIIEPDIYFEIGNPGVSANKVVSDVIDFITNQYSIDKDKLGIFGHSFGGYEANFIITQNPIFKAAVSSSGVSDLRSFYFTINWETLKPDMWRMESQQWRMGKSYYEIPENYLKNSPIEHVDNIQTPLLLISGKEDYQIDWQQSVSMFLALKRLNKTVNLLLYPEEGHVLLKPLNQIDVHNKIKTWFDYYLKDSEEPNWLDGKGLL